MTGSPSSRPLRNAVALRCLPDRGVVRATMGSNGQPNLRVPGQMDVPALADPSLARAFPVMWHAPGKPLVLPARVEAVANLVTSVEDCARGLADLDAVLPAGLPVLNHPRAVALTRRDMAGAVFSPIAGLAVPQAQRLIADSPGAFQRAFAQGGFRFPVRVEPVWDDGDNMPHQIAHPGDWQKIFARPWGGRPFLLVQAEAAEVPYRLMLGMVGKIGHAEIFSAGSGTLPTLPPPAGPEIQRYVQHLMAAVQTCLPLDCWTLEVALAEGRPRFERLVVGPPVVAPSGPLTPRDIAMQKLREAMHRPLRKLLAAPGQWRGDAARAPAVAHTLALHPSVEERRVQ